MPDRQPPGGVAAIEGPGARTGAGGPPSFDRPTVLVIDDDPVIVKLLEVTLELEDYDVVTAVDGPSGIRLALASPPDVVVLDVMMPGMDGLEAARQIRAGATTRAVPILLLSAKAQATDVARGLEVADAYLTKPFEPLELLERVAAMISGDARRSGG